MDYLFGFTNVNFSFNANIAVRTPESGFSLQLGQTGSDFYPVISFSGYSGYIFDQRGFMVGGYIKNEAFAISGNYSTESSELESAGRLSYYIDDVLISNNVSSTGFIDCIRFEGYSDEITADINIIRDTGEFDAIMSADAFYLHSLDNLFLTAYN